MGLGIGLYGIAGSGAHELAVDRQRREPCRGLAVSSFGDDRSLSEQYDVAILSEKSSSWYSSIVVSFRDSRLGEGAAKSLTERPIISNKHASDGVTAVARVTGTAEAGLGQPNDGIPSRLRGKSPFGLARCKGKVRTFHVDDADGVRVVERDDDRCFFRRGEFSFNCTFLTFSGVLSLATSRVARLAAATPCSP
jgi:hypothetical protein